MNIEEINYLKSQVEHLKQENLFLYEKIRNLESNVEHMESIMGHVCEQCCEDSFLTLVEKADLHDEYIENLINQNKKLQIQNNKFQAQINDFEIQMKEFQNKLKS